MGLTELDAQSLIAKLRTGTSKLVLVDTTQPRIDFANRILLAVDNFIEIEVLSLESLDVDGVETPTGGSDDDWSWDVATQELIQAPPAATPPTSINTEYKARYVVERSSGAVPFVDRVTINQELPDPAAAEAFAQSQIDLHRRARETLPIKILAGSGLNLSEGEGLSLRQEILDALRNLTGASEDDVFRIDRLSIRGRGILLEFDLRVLRRADESRYRDQWRVGVFHRQ